MGDVPQGIRMLRRVSPVRVDGVQFLLAYVPWADDGLDLVVPEREVQRPLPDIRRVVDGCGRRTTPVRLPGVSADELGERVVLLGPAADVHRDDRIPSQLVEVEVERLGADRYRASRESARERRLSHEAADRVHEGAGGHPPDAVLGVLAPGAVEAPQQRVREQAHAVGACEGRLAVQGREVHSVFPIDEPVGSIVPGDRDPAEDVPAHQPDEHVRPGPAGVHEEHLLRGPAVVETARQRLEVQRAVQRAVPVGEDVRREEGGVRPERDAVAAEVEDQPGLVVVAAVLPLRDGGHDVVDGRRFTTCPTFVLGWTKGAGAVSLSRSARLPNGLASSWY
nr:hypothetical protein [Streptomyces viridochromogenes]